MAGNEPVTSPDQHRPTISNKLARLGAVASILILLSLLIAGHPGWVEYVFLIGSAAVLAVILIADWLLGKNGLKSH